MHGGLVVGLLAHLWDLLIFLFREESSCEFLSFARCFFHHCISDNQIIRFIQNYFSCF